MMNMESESGIGIQKGKRVMNTFSVKNKVMVITGGTNGIGRGLTDYFVEQGHRSLPSGAGRRRYKG